MVGDKVRKLLRSDSLSPALCASYGTVYVPSTGENADLRACLASVRANNRFAAIEAVLFAGCVLLVWWVEPSEIGLSGLLIGLAVSVLAPILFSKPLAHEERQHVKKFEERYDELDAALSDRGSWHTMGLAELRAYTAERMLSAAVGALTIRRTGAHLNALRFHGLLRHYKLVDDDYMVYERMAYTKLARGPMVPS